MGSNIPASCAVKLPGREPTGRLTSLASSIEPFKRRAVDTFFV